MCRYNAAARKIASTRLAAAEKRKASDPKWRDMQVKREKLPAFAMRAEVLECIEGGRAAVISGATGCGKTTQVPQFVFESAVSAGNGGECSIIITQPRRLSAIAVVGLYKLRIYLPHSLGKRLVSTLAPIT